MWKYLILILFSFNSFAQNTEELEFIKNLNELRKDSPLEYSDEFYKLAFYHTEYMIYSKDVSHDNYENRVKEIQRKYKVSVSECVAYGDNLLNTLLSSPTHKELLLKVNYNKITLKIKGKYITVILYE